MNYKNGIGIEYEIDHNFKDNDRNFIYGNFRFIINGRKLGSFEELTTISIVVAYMREFIGQRKLYEYLGSENLTKECLFYELHDVFIADTIPPKGVRQFIELHRLNLGMIRNQFWLDEIGEDSFRDKISCIIVDEPYMERERLVWKDLRSNKVFEEFLSPGLFRRALIQFVETINAEYGI
ncbi:hypothetical protein DVR12_17845 [Chitinophaga silvatica]|uniref:Uncharacterized protein n=1 Tax=Chitinophaga silvatica TaxID=2282649 RepID=A0A3E1Y7Z0_9BACT|nr:Imm42 family immunity protein [Chitinophaga silvatica]RFS21197.1 hypothetical protein DVR12_17845 [Chitinophaga silvatica]